MDEAKGTANTTYPSVGGLVLAQDNARDIGEVVDQLGEICESVLVVDGGSRDGTPEIAAQRPFVRVIERRFDTHARQRNFALQQMHSDWVLSLDTDERLSDSARWLIPLLVRIPGLARFHFPRLWLVHQRGRLCYLRGRPYYRDRQLRLFRCRPSFRYAEISPVHHPLLRGKRDLGLRVRAPVIFHFCLLADPEERKAKVARYRALDPDPERERLHRFYLWEDLVAERAIPIVPLSARYQQRFALQCDSLVQ